MPAFTAAKCAERQGAAAFAALHRALFVAHFQHNLDISQPEVLWRLAQGHGVDMARFQEDARSGAAHQAVLHDYAEAVAWFGVSALPTVIFNEQVSLVGAVPVAQYRLLLDWFLAGAPGGLIPLDVGDPAHGTPGQSPVK
jgi:predicted DsbA family dithiol-disulfide isomerase